jgi:hypothetical protein
VNLLKQRPGYEEEGGLYATEDDGNPAWVDIKHVREDRDFEKYLKRIILQMEPSKPLKMRRCETPLRRNGMLRRPARILR